MNATRLIGIGCLHINIDSAKLVTKGPVTDIAVDKRRVWNDNRLLLKSLNFGCTNADLFYDTANGTCFDPVAHFERTFSQKNKARNEVLDNVLQAKTDTK